jgi:hypothetical protein
VSCMCTYPQRCVGYIAELNLCTSVSDSNLSHCFAGAVAAAGSDAAAAIAGSSTASKLRAAAWHSCTALPGQRCAAADWLQPAAAAACSSCTAFTTSGDQRHSCSLLSGSTTAAIRGLKSQAK